MKFLSFLLLLSTTKAFAPATPLTFAPRLSRSSSLQMVADDAKVCLVTGSSRGLGKAIALELGKAGQKVVINYVSDGSKDAAETTVEEIKAAGGDAIAVQADSKYFLTRKSRRSGIASIYTQPDFHKVRSRKPFLTCLSKPLMLLVLLMSS
jgi:hypothetical protein